MDKTLEIVNKDIKKIKLTVTPTRIAIKLPTEFTDDNPWTGIKLAQILDIAKYMDDTEVSLRGSVKRDDDGIEYIIMSNRYKSISRRFLLNP